MFQLLPCPTCQRSMVLRSGVSQQATLKCPSCQSQFQLHDILASYYEQWEILDDPTPELVAPGSAASQHTIQLDSEDDGIELELQPEAHVEPQLSSKTETIKVLRAGHAVLNKVDWSQFKPITHEEYQRLRRKATSPVWTFVQIVLGGLAAIPVALLLIWHVVGTDIGGAAPTVARYLPWIVPEKFRPLAASDNMLAVEFDHLEHGMSDFRQFEDTNELVAPLKEDRPGELDSKPSFEKVEAADPANENVFASIGKCNSSLQAWIDGRDGDKPQRQRLAQGLYSDLTSLAGELNQLGPNHPTGRAVREKVDGLARLIAEQEDVKALILAGAKANLRDKTILDKHSLAAVTKITKVDETENEWRIIPEPSLEGEPVLPAIIVPRLFAPSILEGDELLILGEYMQTTGEGTPPSAEFRAAYIYAFHAT